MTLGWGKWALVTALGLGCGWLRFVPERGGHRPGWMRFAHRGWGTYPRRRACADDSDSCISRVQRARPAGLRHSPPANGQDR